MKVWQFGSHLTDERGAQIEDWSWRQTRRRIRVLLRLSRPYRARTTLAVASLDAYTGVALLPPYLSKVAVDDGIEAGDLHTLSLVVLAFVAAGIAAFVLSGAQTYFTGWVGERALADLRGWMLGQGLGDPDPSGIAVSAMEPAEAAAPA